MFVWTAGMWAMTASMPTMAVAAEGAMPETAGAASSVRAASPVYVAPNPAQAVTRAATQNAASATPAPLASSQRDWQARDWAMACMSCHNAAAPVSEGKPALASLEGRPAASLMAALDAMRDGKRPATLMPQLLKGYRDDELQRIAAYFADAAAQPAMKASLSPASHSAPAGTSQ